MGLTDKQLEALSSPLRLKEKDVQNTCVALLQLDGWRHIRLEQNFSVRKRKTIGEPGMADSLFIRYTQTKYSRDKWPAYHRSIVDLMFVEWKRIMSSRSAKKTPLRATKASLAQKTWHSIERSRGALTLIAGEDFPASIEGFREWYEASGLQRHTPAQVARLMNEYEPPRADK